MPEPQKSRVLIEDQPHWRRDPSGYIELGAIFNVDGERYWIRFYDTLPEMRLESVPAMIRWRIVGALHDLDREAVKVGILYPPRGSEILHLPMLPEGAFRMFPAVISLVESEPEPPLH